MKITTLNCNGLRSAVQKGFFDWLRKEGPDVLCLQKPGSPTSYGKPVVSSRRLPLLFHNALKKGYSGVAVFCKTEPDSVIAGDGWETMRGEGRYLEARFGKLSVVSLYLPLARADRNGRRSSSIS